MNRSPVPTWTESREDGERARVLYVDADAESFVQSRARLRRAYDVLHARHDREACELVRAHHHELVAVLLDIELPGSVLDGILLARVFRGRAPEAGVPPFARNLPPIDAPIVLLREEDSGAYSEPELARYGADRLLGKPLDLHTLTLTLTEWHLHRAREPVAR